MINPAITLDTNPTSTYIAGLAPGSYWGCGERLQFLGFRRKTPPGTALALDILLIGILEKSPYYLFAA